MLEIFSNRELISELSYQRDAEASFSLAVTKTHRRNEILNIPYCVELIQKIDGSTVINSNNLNTPFGETGVHNISTGCKAAIVAFLFPDIVVSNIEMGNNVIKAMADVAIKFDISPKVYLDYIDVVTATKSLLKLDGEIMTGISATEILIKLSDSLNKDER